MKYRPQQYSDNYTWVHAYFTSTLDVLLVLNGIVNSATTKVAPHGSHWNVFYHTHPDDSIEVAGDRIFQRKPA